MPGGGGRGGRRERLGKRKVTKGRVKKKYDTKDGAKNGERKREESEKMYG